MTPPGLWSYIADWDRVEVFSILVNKEEAEDGWYNVCHTLSNFRGGNYDLESNTGSRLLHKFYLPLGVL